MFGRKAILPLDLDAGVHQGPCNEAEVTICSQETEIQQKRSQHKALLDEVQKNIFLLRRNRRSSMIRNTVSCLLQCRYTSPEERLQKEKRKGGKLDFPWVGPYLITKSLGKGFYDLQSCGKGRVTTIPRVSHVCIKEYISSSCSPSRRLQSPSASNESHSTASPGRDSPPLGASPS